MSYSSVLAVHLITRVYITVVRTRERACVREAGCVGWGVGGGRETETDRQANRQTETEAGTETDREKDKENTGESDGTVSTLLPLAHTD